MSNPSPICEIKNGSAAYAASAGGVNMTTSATIIIRLASQADVDSWLIECATTDDTSVAATVTASLTIDSLNKTATFTAPSDAGKAYRFRSRVNGGIDRNGVAQSSYETTFCLYTLAGDRRVMAADETTEGDATFGWIKWHNDIVRDFSAGLEMARLSKVGELLATSWTAGNFTGGARFKTHAAFTCTGIRFWGKWTGTKTIKACIYSSASGTPLATASAAIDGTAGGIKTILFSSSLALPATPVGDEYFATVYETGAAVYPLISSAANAATYLGTASFFLRSYVIYKGSAYAAGDALPTSTYGVATTEWYPVEPILE